jgi:hypothetical protein
VKRITRFNPAGDRDAAEPHYTEAHHPFMRGLFREHGDHVIRYRAAPKVGAVDELWFDNPAWAEEFFAGPAVLAQLRDGAGGRVEGYRVTEAIGVDKR